MEENELETMLYHLGQDIGYMGLRLQKDVQKCLKDLKATHDNKTFCDKLADILKKFSEYTGQYAKDLESRVKDFNKEDEYIEITNKLREITAIKHKNEVVSSVTDSELPNDNNDDGQKTEIISQTSLHIEDKDEPKSEQSSLDRSTVLPNESFDSCEFFEQMESPDSTQQQTKDSSSTVPAVTRTNVEVLEEEINNIITEASESSAVTRTNVEVLEEEINNIITDVQEDHSDIANSLEISHSEEVIEDQDNLVLESEIPNTPNDDNDCVEKTLSTDLVEAATESAKESGNMLLQKSVIALPYAPISEEEIDTIKKIDVIALPYEPLFKNIDLGDLNVQSDVVADSESSKPKENQVILVDVADNSSCQNKETNMTVLGCDNGYDSDVEIVSVLSPKDANTSPSDSSDQNTIITSQPEIEALEVSDDSDVEFIDPAPSQLDDKRPKLISKRGRSSHIDESDESDLEQANPIVDRSPRRYSSHNVEPDLEISDKQINSDVKTVENNTVVSNSDDAVINNEKTNVLDAETEESIPSDKSTTGNNDSDKATDNNDVEKPELPKTQTENEALPRLEKPVEEELIEQNSVVSQGDTITQEGSFDSQATICDLEHQNSENGHQAILNDDENLVAGNIDSQISVDFSLEHDNVPPKGVRDEEDNSNNAPPKGVTVEDDNSNSSRDSIYLKKTQKIPVPTPSSNVESDSDVGAEETQVAIPVSAGPNDTNHSADSPCVDDIVNSQCKESGEINSNNDLIGSTEEGDADMVGGMEEEGCLDEMTQEIEIPPNDDTLVDAGDVTMTSCDIATQESFVFDLEKDILDTEAHLPSNALNSADDSTVTVEKSVASPTNNDEEKSLPGIAENRSGGTFSISELEIGENGPHSDASSVVESTSTKKKINLKEKDRKSLLKVIAQFYLKRKKEKVEAAKKEREESKESAKKSDDNKKSEKIPTSKKGKKLSEEEKKKKAISKKGDKVAKDYLDFVNESRIDENSKSSVESNKDDVNIQEDNSDSDMDATQIENFENKNGEINKMQEKEDEMDNKDIEDKESNSKNSSDSEDLFADSSEKGVKEPKEVNQTFSELLDTLCLKPLEPNPEKKKDLGDSSDIEDLDLTQKVDDIRKLRDTNSEKSSVEDKVDRSPENSLSPPETNNDEVVMRKKDSTDSSDKEDPDLTQKVDDLRTFRHINSIEENVECNIVQDVQNELSHSDEDENQVVSPHKKKFVRPLPVTQSDNEDVFGEVIDENEVVSPHKKKFVRPLPITQSDQEDDLGPDRSPEDDSGPETDNDEIGVSPLRKKGVKRLLSSEESDVEPPKRSSETKDSEENVKRSAAKRLLSTASEADQKASDVEDSDIDHASKKKVRRLLSSEDSDPDRNKDSDKEMDNERSYVQPSQFRLDDRARDDLLDLLNEPKQEASGSEKYSCDVVSSASERDEHRDDDVVPVVATQFQLNDCDRDNLLNLLNDKENEEKSDELDETLEQFKAEIKANYKTEKVSDVDEDDDAFNDGLDEALKEFKSEIKANIKTVKVSDVAVDDDEDDAFSESNHFKLNSNARDELLDLFNSDQHEESDAQNDDIRQKVKESTSGKKEADEFKQPASKEQKEDDADKEIEPSQFRLDDQARDDLLSMLSNDPSDDSRDIDSNMDQEGMPDIVEDNSKVGCNDEDGVSKISSDDVENENGRVMDALLNIEDDKDKEDGDEDDNIDDSGPENSQGMDDSDDLPEEDENIEETKSDEEKDDDENIEGTKSDEEKGDDEIIEKDDQKNITKENNFHLDENDRDDLLNILNEYIEKRDGSESEDSESDAEKDDENNGDEIKKKGNKRAKKIDKDTLLELVKEYENILVEGKDNELVENVLNGGDMEVGNMGMESDNEMLPGSNNCAGSDAESVLLDLLREETVNQDDKMPNKRGRKKSLNTNKAAWEAYKQLLKESDDVSGESSEISDSDVDDLELDFSDQEKKQKDQKTIEKLLKKYKISRELVVNVEQADISGFDVEVQSRREENVTDKVDRLCDLSNVLHKRKYRRKHALPRRKRPKLSVRANRAHSDSDDSYSPSSDSSLSSDGSVCANWDSSSRRGSSPLRLSDDNAEQDRLANALWEDIRNSSDDENSERGVLSSVGEGDSGSSDDEMMGRKKKKSGGGGKKREKIKKEESEGDEKESGSEESEGEGKSDSGKDSDLNGKEEKIAGLDSSDEEDFVGARKNRGAWRHDPLLKGCLTSDDDSDFESENSGAEGGKKVRSYRLRKGKRKTLVSENDEDKETPIKDDGGSSDSDVEFITEKKKTPKKPDSPEQEEDDTPSKIGKGRRNIRALVEDDELAESTKRANKEETERIRRLQQREKAKEIFTQSQSLGSQLSEDEVDPLILDVQDDFQIKVHPKITKKLKPHQRKGIQFMWDSCYESVEQLKKDYIGSGCILAHCMGLGKTLQALGLIHTLFNYKETKTKHVLVVCPLSTVSNWRNEFILAYKNIRDVNIKLYTIENKKAGADRFSIVEKWHRTGGLLVMGYECFGLMTNDEKLDKDPLRDKDKVKRALVKPGPDLIICDEGHLLRNKQTQRTLALNKVATRRRIVLTGTPLQNNLIEYYYMVNFVKPNLLGTEKEYKTNFVNPIQNGQFENSTATDILFMKQRTHVLHKILAKTVQRVEDTELKQYLPQLVDQALFLKLSDLQVNFYNTYLDNANERPVTYTRAGNICRKNFLADCQILRYICTHPDIVTIAKKSGKSKKREQDVIDDNMDEAIEDKLFSRGDWYRQILPADGVKKPELGTKMIVALGIVEEAVASNDKTLIFSQSHAEMDSLEYFLQTMLNFKKGVDYNRMDGTISPEVRTHMCDKFNNPNSKKLRVFLMSTQVGGLGLNLTAANRVIIMNVHWNPSYDTQSVFRAFRFGQNKAVYVYRLIAKDTMEEKMYQRQVTKLAVAHRVVDKHQITRHYSAADIQEFYSVRPTIASERPLPNVPEDRVLAKLIQKFQFVYKWHEHQALLANRPEEDLDEQQKNAAWEQFNRRADEPPPQLLPPGMTAGPVPPQFLTATDILQQPGPSGLQIQNRIMATRYPLPGSATQTSATGHFVDHNYSLPKANLVSNQQRTTSADDFRTTTQPKYVPRPIFVDVTAPLGPRPNLSGSNPLASQKSRLVGSKAPAQNHTLAQKHAPAQRQIFAQNHAPVSNPLSTTSSTQVRFGSGVSISSSQANSSKSQPPPAHAQKPSISIIPHTASAKPNSNVAAAKPNTNVAIAKPNSNGAIVKPPHFVPKSANLVQNPLNLTKNLNVGNVAQGQRPVGNAFIVNKKGAPPLHKPHTKIVKVPQPKPVQPPPLSRLTTTEPPPLARMATTTASPIVAPTSKFAVAPPTQTNRAVANSSFQINRAIASISSKINRAVASSPSQVNRAVASSTAPVSSGSTTQSSSSESAPATSQQSPLQKQIRGFMDHLHMLQQSMRNGNTAIPNTVTKDSNATAAPLIVNTPLSASSQQKTLVPNPVVPRTVIRVGPRNLSPVIGPAKAGQPIIRLNAARNLSNLPKTYQRTKSNVSGVPTTSQNVIPPAQPQPASNRPIVRVIGSLPNTHVPPGYGTPHRVTMPNNTAAGYQKVGTTDNNGPRIFRKSTNGNVAGRPLVMAPVGVVNRSGQKVASGAGYVNGAAPRVVSVPQGSKKIVISPIRKHNTPVRVDQLQKKLYSNMNKSYGIAANNLPKEAPRNTFNNGANVITRTYQNQSNKQSNSPLRTSSLPSLSLSQPTISVSKSNKENRSRKRLSLKTNNNSGSTPTLVDLSNEEDGDGNVSGSSLSQDMVSTLRKKGVSINYLGKGNEKDVISLD